MFRIRYTNNSDQLIRSIREMNLTKDDGGSSGCCDILEMGYKPIEGHIVTLNGKRIGWSVRFKTDIYGDETHIYIDLPHRNKGYAQKLIKRIKKDIDNPVFAPWNMKTLYLFKKTKVKYKNEYI